MKTVFADTGYWIAISDPRDELHERAKAVTAQLVPLHIVTSEMVLTEFLDFVSSHGVHTRNNALNAVREWLTSPGIEVIPQTSERFRAALERYAQRLDKQWSLTDCSSFLIMEELNIEDALAHDRDFQQAGFRPLLRQAYR